jgi:hypothetical protein
MAKKPAKAPKVVVIYQAKNGAIELRGDTARETLWLTQSQVADIFDVQKAAVSKHVKNIFDSGELDRKATVSKMETVQTEGSRTVRRAVEYYNLDLALSIGYRVNTKKATQFRQWATKTLRQHIVDGYTINRSRIGANYDAFMAAVGDIQALLPGHVAVDPKLVLELVKEFSATWVALDAYDKDTLAPIGTTKRAVELTGEELAATITSFRDEMLKSGEVTELFAQERVKGSIQGIVGNVMQSFGGKELYPSIEEKAANLMYFIIKNHPFSDGNKRSGAFSFAWFLRYGRSTRARAINPIALTALTLLVAESAPKDKDRLVGLITMLLGLPRQ